MSSNPWGRFLISSTNTCRYSNPAHGHFPGVTAPPEAAAPAVPALGQAGSASRAHLSQVFLLCFLKAWQEGKALRGVCKQLSPAHPEGQRASLGTCSSLTLGASALLSPAGPGSGQEQSTNPGN